MHLTQGLDPVGDVLEHLSAHDGVERSRPERLRQVEHTRLLKRHREAELLRPPSRRLEMVDVDSDNVQPVGERNERLPDVERLAQPATADIEDTEPSGLPELRTEIEDQTDLRRAPGNAGQVEPGRAHLVEHAGRRGRKRGHASTLSAAG